MEHASTIALPELSSEQQDVVRQTLQSILESPYFSKSKRYPALLEFVVLHSLDRNAGTLKERTVGIEVFGRPQTYEPGTDPIVRVAAGEVRRRIAVYYSEHADAPVRIDFPLGQYNAEFHFRQPAEDVVAPEPEPSSPYSETLAVPEQAVAEAPEPVPPAITRSHRSAWLAATVVAILLAAAGAAWWHHVHRFPKHDFWGPVLSDSVPATIVLGDSTQASDVQRWTQSGLNASPSGGTSMANALTAAQTCNIFRSYGRSCEVIPATKADLTNLQNKTVVYIGRDNDWAHRIVAPLPYRFQSETVATTSYPVESIIDQAGAAGNPVIWKTTSRQQNYTDYAVVARFQSDITDGIAVVEAGLTSSGTLGAAQFVSSRDNVQAFFAQAPKSWKGFNFEVVLQIDVVQGAPGHVKVVAAQFW